MRILVTAGPTREPIDPIRFISNYSTGTIGYAIAKKAEEKGHRVILIKGPTALKPLKGIKIIDVTTAREMFKAVRLYHRNCDCVIMSAAVSDFYPAIYYNKKIKRTTSLRNIKLKKNPDILSWLGTRKREKILIGFCMETNNLLKNAREKLKAKNLDIIVANRIDEKRKAFGTKKTSVIILGAEEKQHFVNMSKEKIADILLDKIEKLWYKI